MCCHLKLSAAFSLAAPFSLSSLMERELKSVISRVSFIVRQQGSSALRSVLSEPSQWQQLEDNKNVSGGSKTTVTLLAEFVARDREAPGGKVRCWGRRECVETARGP